MSLSSKWFEFGQNAYYDSALVAMAAHDWDIAIAHLTIALETSHSPTLKVVVESLLVECWIKLSLLSLAQNNPQLAVRRIQHAVQLRPDYPDFQVLLGRAYCANGDRELAMNAFDKALSISPKYVKALLWRAYCLEASGHPESPNAWEAASEFDPTGTLIVRKAIESSKESEDPTERYARVYEAIETTQSGVQRLIERANGQAEAKFFVDAATTYSEVLKLAPTYADAHCKLGQCLMELDAVAEALASFEAALAINARYGEALVQRGIALKRLGRHAESKNAFIRAREIVPNHPIVWFELGRV